MSIIKRVIAMQRGELKNSLIRDLNLDGGLLRSQESISVQKGNVVRLKEDSKTWLITRYPNNLQIEILECFLKEGKYVAEFYSAKLTISKDKIVEKVC